MTSKKKKSSEDSRFERTSKLIDQCHGKDSFFLHALIIKKLAESQIMISAIQKYMTEVQELHTDIQIIKSTFLK